MGLRDEIDYVIQEQERKRRRTTQRIQRSSRMLVKPTYFAIVIAWVIVRWRSLFRKPEPVGSPQRRNVKPDVTFMTLLKSDIRAFRKRLFPVKRPKKVPGADETWKDWEGQV